MENLLKTITFFITFISVQQIIAQPQGGIWGASFMHKPTQISTKPNTEQTFKQNEMLLIGTMDHALTDKKGIAIPDDFQFYFDKFYNKLNQGWSSLQSKMDETYSLLFWKP